MRFLIKVSIPVEAGNTLVKSGKLGETIQSILAELKPEAAYFVPYNGQRTAFLFADLRDSAQLPRVAEPWRLALNASVEFHPAMNAQDLMKAGPDIAQAVKNYA